MLPTPDTSHVPYERVYEPAEDSFLLLDVLSSPSESQHLTSKFQDRSPLVVEVGTGSGVVLAFTNAHATHIFGHRRILTAGVDMNAYACRATMATISKAQVDNPQSHGMYLGSCMGDLTSSFMRGSVDVLIFNPPYVPTSELPEQPDNVRTEAKEKTTFDDDSYLLSLSYAGGRDGMETTDRLIDELPLILSPKGCAYILFCAQNKPDEVKQRINSWGSGWMAQTVGSSGKTAGREKLQVVRIWREEGSS